MYVVDGRRTYGVLTTSCSGLALYTGSYLYTFASYLSYLNEDLIGFWWEANIIDIGFVSIGNRIGICTPDSRLSEHFMQDYPKRLNLDS